MSGYWSVSVDGVFLSETLFPAISAELAGLGIDLVTDTEANTTTFTNLGGQDRRLQLQPIDATPVTPAASNNNPTLVVDDLNTVTFCLLGAT